MDIPFFRSQRNQPSRARPSPAFRGIPVETVHRTPVEPAQRKAKVVSIPVHFVGSETAQSALALKIQKVFRGFLVRKSVKTIVSISREVEGIERRISQSETVELIRRDTKERLRVSESLMALLFKLDSVRGVDSAVRDCRKKVIKKAIALQEKVDAIAAGNQVAEQTLETKDSTEPQILEVEGKESGTEDHTSVSIDDNKASQSEQSAEVIADSAVPQTLEVGGKVTDTVDPATVLIDDNEASGNKQVVEEIKQSIEAPYDKDDDGIPNNNNFLEKAVDESRDVNCPDATAYDFGDAEEMLESKGEGCVEAAPEICENMDIAEVMLDCEVNGNEEACVVKQIVEDQRVNPTITSENLQGFIEGTKGNLKDCCVVRGDRDDQKHNTELLERMMEDNEKMMRLMTQLFERNEMQTRMLSSLTHRVGQLERAFLCERLRRKKKRCAVSTVDGLESNPDQKKCGKRE